MNKAITTVAAFAIGATVGFFAAKKFFEENAVAADVGLHSYLLTAVTEGYSYEYLKAKLNIPCCKDTYYELYRRFFWLLSKARN